MCSIMFPLMSPMPFTLLECQAVLCFLLLFLFFVFFLQDELCFETYAFKCSHAKFACEEGVFEPHMNG